MCMLFCVIPDFAGGSRLQLIEKPSKISVSNTNKSYIQGLSTFGKPIHIPTNQKRTVVSCTKTPEATETAKPNGKLYCS